MTMPPYSPADWIAAGRAAEQAGPIVDRLRTAAANMDALLRHLDAANARVLRADDPAAAAAALEPALRSMRDGQLPALLAACNEAITAANVYTPLLDAILGVPEEE
jgi:hypothetical protein